METSKLLALKLSALNENDFNWVFGQLKQEVKDELSPIVAEIKDIGFEVSQSDIDVLLKKNAVSHLEQSQDEDIQLIAKASYEQVRKIFTRETLVLLNTLSELEDWEWKSDQEYASKVGLSTVLTVSDVESKNMLKKSLISATAKHLRKSNLTADSDEKPRAYQHAIPKIFTAMLRRRQQ